MNNSNHLKISIIVISITLMQGCSGLQNILATGPIVVDDLKNSVCGRNELKNQNSNTNKQPWSSPRTLKMIQSVMDCNKGSITRLYNRALRRKPGTGGDLVLELTISPEGDITHIKKLPLLSELEYPEFEDKLVDLIKLFKFPKIEGNRSATIRYPVNFTNPNRTTQKNRYSRSDLTEDEIEKRRIFAEKNKLKKKFKLEQYTIEELYPNERVRRLAIAAAEGNLDEIDSLVKQGIDVNTKSFKKATPLFWAMKNIQGYKHLLELGADPNILFDTLETVLHLSVSEKNTNDLLIEALKHGGDPNLKVGNNRETPIFHLLRRQKLSIAKLNILLDAGADINARNSTDFSFIMWAASLLRFELVYEALNKGADYRAIAKNAFTFQTILERANSKRSKLRPKDIYWLDKVIAWMNEKDIIIGVRAPFPTNDKKLARRIYSVYG